MNESMKRFDRKINIFTSQNMFIFGEKIPIKIKYKFNSNNRSDKSLKTNYLSM